MPEPLLELESLQVSFGGSRALDGASLEVGAGEFVAIVGPNGAGKTTLFRTLSGTVALESGSMRFDGQDLGRAEPSARAALGIAHVPEGRQVFPRMTVLENLEMGAQTRAARRAWKQTLDFVYGLFPRLHERRAQAAGTLSGGEQQMVAIARGLASLPRLLLLDEPSMGLAPAIVDQIFETVQRIHAQGGLAILLVEQRAAEALEACSRGYVLESGRIVLQGRHEELLRDPRVKQAYLGQ
ncbi:MAG: ABC transporter ATP-binding protein [Burkholderiales bacterium]|nr:ABC transporter ATP-binding protein [Burkholderiales bacterium]MDE2394866.1 ABC transporter ATP-binding protein [Burkholderiales bacterium]MDE2453938.1 ABC transporter ATP-binding protein [Burkholderiales bacterium]